MSCEQHALCCSFSSPKQGSAVAFHQCYKRFIHCPAWFSSILNIQRPTYMLCKTQKSQHLEIFLVKYMLFLLRLAILLLKMTMMTMRSISLLLKYGGLFFFSGESMLESVVVFMLICYSFYIYPSLFLFC